ncbi:DUF4400 domain-containing protein [Photobacterium damselae]|uniref:DUF4400 domain-containing protein n=1 Tax=Photobacterium damselae TaxID=38293 RepID=UPI000D662D65|nr:DUF4400 domain-containing protein [Photobacterium damselae]AWK84656.1 hypothetical protein BST98_21760 [Photobacterium damselae]MBE8127685.1 DUF4400 domain-containing protein [Photobacterium damselae subsp. piscicida]MCG3826474.1 DUF4400 domain-containing protein [Photobacterium damselae]NVO59001.1 DUF4400 domain-containing protein [Photobacterium damselae subsp. damselae]TLS83981.1 DUF4400 domain-containing protein [Photobacterium damselae subsp. damselae]
MVDKIKKKEYTFMQRFIFIIAALSIGYLILLMEPQSYRETLQSEINSYRSIAGPTESKIALARAYGMYKWAFINSNIVPAMEAAITPTEYYGQEYWQKPVIRVVENIKLLFYQSCYRISVFISWFILGLPLMLALGADGYYKRKMKQYEFGVASANLYRIWVKTGLFAFFIIDLYFIFPAAGIFGVILPPAMFLILGLSTRYALSNVSKVF